MPTRRLFRVTQVTEGTSANVSRTLDRKWKWNILPKLKKSFLLCFCSAYQTSRIRLGACCRCACSACSSLKCEINVCTKQRCEFSHVCAGLYICLLEKFYYFAGQICAASVAMWLLESVICSKAFRKNEC